MVQKWNHYLSHCWPGVECSWQHAVCRVNHPSGMPIVSPHGTFFLLILTGMCLDVEDTLFLHPLPFPQLCQAKGKVRQLRSQAHRIQADKLASPSLQDTCPPPDNRYSCCSTRHDIHYRSYHLHARTPIILVLVTLL